MDNIELDTFTGPIPLPDVQRIFLDRQWPDYEYPEHMERRYPDADQFVMWRPYLVKADLNQEMLERAVHALLLQHEGLRIRLAKEGGRWLQYLVALDELAPVVWEDFSALPKEERGEAIMAAFLKVLHSLDLTHGHIMKCLYMKLGAEEPDQLVLFFNHVLIDGVSVQIARNDLFTAITQLYSGQEIVLPPKTTSLKDWQERVETCLHSEEWKAEIERLIAYKHSWAPPVLKTLPLDYREEKLDEKTADRVHVSLSKQETTTLQKQAATMWKVRFLDLLQMAMVRAFAPWAGVSSLPLCIVTHGRDPIFEDIDLSRTIGSFILGLLDVLECKEDMRPQFSPLADPRLLFAQVLLNFSRSAEMVYEGDDQEKYVSIYDRYNPQIVLNFQRFADDFAHPNQKGLFEEFRGEVSDYDIRVPSKTLDCYMVMFQGQLDITVAFSPRYFKHSTIEQLAQTFLRELRAFIKTT